MKTNQLTQKLFTFFILISLIVSFNSCKKDNETELTQTFLEKYNGTTWEDENIYYVKFYNNTTTPFVFWQLDTQSNCYSKSDFLANGVVEIIENSSKILIVKITENEPHSYTHNISFTVDGDNIIAYNDEYEIGDVINFNKSIMNVDNLEVCVD